MNREQIADYCERYFRATGSHIIEKAPYRLKVKLSPEADRDLTGRTYYWNFVERTGAEAETMSFAFIFDPNAVKNKPDKPDESNNGGILGRYFGMPPILPQPGRMLEETVVFGSRRLDQIFSSASDKGAYLQLFEEPPVKSPGSAVSVPYTTWLGVNYKVEFICDMKREELHSLGICMSTGEIATGFFDKVKNLRLSPRMPARTMLRETISFQRAVVSLETYLEGLLKAGDYRWAKEAMERMNEELFRIDAYYGELLQSTAELQQKEEITSQYRRKKEEIEWQYGPRIEAIPLNCGYYHLLADTFRQTSRPMSDRMR